MSRINQKVRDNTFIYYLFYILCFGCVALCEPIKNINYLYGIGLLMLLLKVGARNSHITLSVFFMMLLVYAYLRHERNERVSYHFRRI